MVTFYMSLQLLPLADAMTMFFTNPAITTVRPITVPGCSPVDCVPRA